MIHTSQLTAFQCQHQRLVNEHSCLHVQYLHLQPGSGPNKTAVFFLQVSFTPWPFLLFPPISLHHTPLFFCCFFLLCLSRRGQISEDISHGSQHCPILWSIWQREGEGRMSRSLFFPVCWVWLLLSSALLKVSNSETFMWCSEEESTMEKNNIFLLCSRIGWRRHKDSEKISDTEQDVVGFVIY